MAQKFKKFQLKHLYMASNSSRPCQAETISRLIWDKLKKLHGVSLTENFWKVYIFVRHLDQTFMSYNIRCLTLLLGAEVDNLTSIQYFPTDNSIHSADSLQTLCVLFQ